jgi:hypothetical protein
VRRSFIIQGFFGLCLMSGILHAQLLYTLESPNPYQNGFFGSPIDGVDDWNSDGFDDIAVSAVGEYSGPENRWGRVYVLSGSDGVLLHVFEWDTQNNTHFGYSLSGGGDLNNDGYVDLLVKGVGGDIPYDPDYYGMVFAFSGQTGEELYHWGGTPYISCCMPGDINGDEYDDVLIGNSDIACLYSGNGFGLLYSIQSPNDEPGWDGFGYSMTGVNDVDGDGCVDLVMGAHHENGGAQGAGRAYLFSGANGQLLHTFESSYPESDGQFGASVSRAGDTNNDGYDDFLIGAFREDGGAVDAGRVYLFNGTNGQLLHTIESAYPESSCLFGRSVSGVDDVNNDGKADLLIGAYREDGCLPDAGRAYLFSGTGVLLYTFESSNPETAGYYGYSVAGIGDATGDGFPEIAIGAYREDGGALNAGRGYVYSGAAVPVELSTFGAEASREGVVLRWRTETEHRCFGFHLYRQGESDDRRQRITQQIVPGSGTSSIPRDYSYLDPVTESGMYRYWLEEVAEDGKRTEFGPAEVTINPRQLTLIGPIPNPLRDLATLRLLIPGGLSDHVELRLYDLSGRQVGSARTFTFENDIEIRCNALDEGVSPGLYWWRLTAGNQTAICPMVVVR